jgi:hypothetical protein
MVYEQERRTNQAIAEVQKAIDLSGGMSPGPFLRFDPRLNNPRTEPRFQDFARRIGLSF